MIRRYFSAKPLDPDCQFFLRQKCENSVDELDGVSVFPPCVVRVFCSKFINNKRRGSCHPSTAHESGGFWGGRKFVLFERVCFLPVSLNRSAGFPSPRNSNRRLFGPYVKQKYWRKTSPLKALRTAAPSRIRRTCHSKNNVVTIIIHSAAGYGDRFTPTAHNTRCTWLRSTSDGVNATNRPFVHKQAETTFIKVVSLQLFWSTSESVFTRAKMNPTTNLSSIW